MHTLNPFASRSYNSKVTNWRVLQLKGLLATSRHLLDSYSFNVVKDKVEAEIAATKKAYSDYVEEQFGTCVDSACALKDPDTICENCMCWKQTRANCS